MNNIILQGKWPTLDQDGHKVGESPMLTHHEKYSRYLVMWGVVFVVALGCVLARML